MRNHSLHQNIDLIARRTDAGGARQAHTIEPGRKKLHGVFSRDLPPVLAVEAGDLVVFRTLDAGWGLTAPRARTSAGWLTFGFDRDPDEAAALAVDGMLGLMGELLGVDRHTALALASVAVDLRVTQVVNEVWGIHALLPHGAIR
jgi:acetamidase/formamidase